MCQHSMTLPAQPLERWRFRWNWGTTLGCTKTPVPPPAPRGFRVLVWLFVHSLMHSLAVTIMA